LQRSDAVENATVFTGAFAELEQVGWQALGAHQLAITRNQYIAMAKVRWIDFVAIEERIVLVCNVASFAGICDLLGQASAERVGAGNDHAIINAQFHEGITDSADLREEVFVRNGNLAILMTALLFIRNLILDLDAACAGFDELLGEQIGRFGVAETCVDIGDDRNDVRFERVDLREHAVGVDRIASRLGRIKLAEHHAQFAGIGLLQERVEFRDQIGNAGLFMHRLVGQRAEFATQRGDHPAGQIKIATLGGAEVLLDRNHLLLADEPVPATQRLRVVGWIGVISSHIAAHDLGGVTRNVDAGQETVLQAHARY